MGIIRAQSILIGVVAFGPTALAACDGATAIQTGDVETVESALINAPGCGNVPTNSVCACQGTNFTGSCVNFTTDLRFFGNLGTYSSGVYNDNIESLWVGPDAKTKVCEDPGMLGLCMSASGAAPNGTSNYNLSSGCGLTGQGCCNHGDCPDPWCCQYNRISSLRVDNKSDDCRNPGLNHVAFFDDINYGGDCVVLYQQSGVLLRWPDPKGNATNATQGGAFGLRDKSISSVKIGVVGQGHSFWFYEGTNFTGAFYSNGASVPNLLSVGWNDRASSIFSVQ